MNKKNITKTVWLLVLSLTHSMSPQQDLIPLPGHLGELEQFVNKAVEQRFSPQAVQAGLFEVLGISLPDHPETLSLAESGLRCLYENQQAHIPIAVYFNFSAIHEPAGGLPQILNQISVSRILFVKDIFIDLEFNQLSDYSIKIRLSRISNERVIVKDSLTTLEMLHILQSDKIIWCSIRLTLPNHDRDTLSATVYSPFKTVDHQNYTGPASPDQVAEVIQRFYDKVFRHNGLS